MSDDAERGARYRAYLLRRLESENYDERAYADVFLSASARARACVYASTADWEAVNAQYPWFAAAIEQIVDISVRDTLSVLIEKELFHG